MAEGLVTPAAHHIIRGVPLQGNAVQVHVSPQHAHLQMTRTKRSSERVWTHIFPRAAARTTGYRVLEAPVAGICGLVAGTERAPVRARYTLLGVLVHRTHISLSRRPCADMIHVHHLQ